MAKKAENNVVPGPGHNVGGIDGKKLEGYVSRVERVREEINALKWDEREIMEEAKGAGFKPKIIRKVVALRAMDPEKRKAEAEEIDTYCHALGMEWGDTPLAQAAQAATSDDDGEDQDDDHQPEDDAEPQETAEPQDEPIEGVEESEEASSEAIEGEVVDEPELPESLDRRGDDFEGL